jgi:hypothetical protein
LSGGTAVVIKTILKFTNCMGVVLSNSGLRLRNVAIVGDGSNNSGILVGRTSDNLAVPISGFVLLENNCGVNGFGGKGIECAYEGVVLSYSGNAFSNNGEDGLYISNGGTMWSGAIIASGNGVSGFRVIAGGSIWADNCKSCGNGACGFEGASCGSISTTSSIATGNVGNGYNAVSNSAIIAGSSVSRWNGGSGFAVVGNSFIMAQYATANANGGKGFYAGIGGTINASNTNSYNNVDFDYYAWVGSTIYVYGYTGAPTFSPAVNTVGNQNAIIST